ncbi:cob(I)yrinic acid a,c-diamide adenosyltransferase [Salipaludibacillus agaradhaerens]|uniref:cob(I)yrinic acid a,c-diamide adenosyltransferase n=1 Tax=Salipaludibacillus agaradhaerens TaxID=76935 RepID=UPI0021508715|nr:cob(I)yrinic acid a,c-diamide adenosyltransferase [Salipaludibacillus agaradhaerens]MCR6106535.1 cob(I)yrinic acid a,c-diamide adenosyltransferase [Salipaludibacillus agaradhaerens]MCR6118568.1 cob(I)yrinic acid a,c-diamide adenosyltransferase [Salipaludibacillus agaradhaerens]
MKIYTKQGDEGQTQLVGKRVKKTHARVEAYGTLDELNSCIGLAVVYATEEKHGDIVADLTAIQHELFDLGGDLADVTKTQDWKIGLHAPERLESLIDKHWEEAPPIKAFILPGGGKLSAQLHVCRTITRRAERLTVNLEVDRIPPAALPYLNRLSDYFFAAARAVNARSGTEDILYEHGNYKQE